MDDTQGKRCNLRIPGCSADAPALRPAQGRNAVSFGCAAHDGSIVVKFQNKTKKRLVAQRASDFGMSKTGAAPTWHLLIRAGFGGFVGWCSTKAAAIRSRRGKRRSARCSKHGAVSGAVRRDATEKAGRRPELLAAASTVLPSLSLPQQFQHPEQHEEQTAARIHDARNGHHCCAVARHQALQNIAPAHCQCRDSAKRERNPEKHRRREREPGGGNIARAANR